MFYTRVYCSRMTSVKTWLPLNRSQLIKIFHAWYILGPRPRAPAFGLTIKINLIWEFPYASIWGRGRRRVRENYGAPRPLPRSLPRSRSLNRASVEMWNEWLEHWTWTITWTAPVLRACPCLLPHYAYRSACTCLTPLEVSVHLLAIGSRQVIGRYAKCLFTSDVLCTLYIALYALHCYIVLCVMEWIWERYKVSAMHK